MKSDIKINVTNTLTAELPIVREGQEMEVRGLSAFYGATQALADVSIKYEANRITAMIGPSGCGKSTLIRCLNRMHEVIRGAYAAGEVLLDGQNIYAPGADPVRIRRKIGMVFQKPNPFPTLSIYDNVIAGYKLNAGRPQGVSYDEIVERSLRSVALWDEVKDKLKASGGALSGGQQQRLCIARAIAIEPEVMLLDEPCSALDPISTLKVEELMQELRSQYTLVLVTHNMQQAARVSDYTAFFLADEKRIGRLIEYGPTQMIFEQPNMPETADYISGRFGEGGSTVKLVKMLDDLTFDDQGFMGQNLLTDAMGKIARYMLKAGQVIEERRPPYVPVYYIILQGTARVTKIGKEPVECGPGTLIVFVEKEGYTIEAASEEVVLSGIMHWAASA